MIPGVSNGTFKNYFGRGAVVAASLATALSSLVLFSNCKGKQRAAVAAAPSASVAASSSARPDPCYYRRSLQERKPYDYYLWQNGALCRGKEDEEVCSPPPPELLTTNEQIAELESKMPHPTYKRLPSDVGHLKSFLLESEKNGTLTWVGEQNLEIKALFDKIIKESASDQDIHFIIGECHTCEGQTAAVNQWLSQWVSDGVIPATHLAMEYKRTDINGLASQNKLDKYLITGKGNFNFIDRSGKTSEHELKELSRTVNLGYDGCLNVALANLDLEMNQLTLVNYYCARENYAVNYILQRMDPQNKDIVFWLWGSSHAIKDRLPNQIHFLSPADLVVSIVLNGGGNIGFVFDRALRQLGWQNRPFILSLNGYREADFVIHLQILQGEKPEVINNKTDQVLQYIYDRPEK